MRIRPANAWEEAEVRADFLVDLTNGDRRLEAALWLLDALKDPTQKGYTFESPSVKAVSQQVLDLLTHCAVPIAGSPRGAAVLTLREYVKALGYRERVLKLSHLLEGFGYALNDPEGVTVQSSVVLRDEVFSETIKIRLGSIPHTLSDLWDVYRHVKETFVKHLGGTIINDCLDGDVVDTMESLFYNYVDGIL